MPARLAQSRTLAASLGSLIVLVGLGSAASAGIGGECPECPAATPVEVMRAGGGYDPTEDKPNDDAIMVDREDIDFLAMVLAFISIGVPQTQYQYADLNHDLVVDVDDLLLLQDWYDGVEPVPDIVDWNGDDRIEQIDLDAFMVAWMMRHKSADFDGDGTVDGDDLMYWVVRFDDLS